MPAQQSEAQARLSERSFIGKSASDQAGMMTAATDIVVQELADHGAVDWSTLTITVTKNPGSRGWLLVEAQATVMLGASRGTR